MKTDITLNFDEKEDDFVQFGVNIQTIASILTYEANVVLKPFNLTFQQYNVLKLLISSKDKSVNINYISARMLDKNSNGSRLVDKLVRKGWVIKKESMNDKRTMNVEITDLGVHQFEIVYKVILAEYITKICKVISPEETKTINTIFTRMLNNY